MPSFAAILLFTLLCLPFSPCKAEEKVVTLATLTDFVPFCFSKEGAAPEPGEQIPPGFDSRQLQGYSWDMVRESYHAMGFTIVLYVVPWERAVHYLKTGKVDAIFPANRTREREQHYSFSREMVDEMRMVIYLPATSPITWQGLQSLDGMRIAQVRGWAYGQLWANNDKIVKEKTDSILQSFHILDRDRLTGVVGYEAAYDFALRGAGIFEKYRKVGPFEVIRELMMGRKNAPESTAALDAFDQGRNSIETSGRREAIDKKWL
ncbi:MAG: transporter substrate-binding domain-containing protein [Desulforhopalus sp.]|jgi:polar amino acid transport system substrate-binding protein|nr:transporter substrate-binding domain-containing protein [Desulforhopalus sp.]